MPNIRELYNKLEKLEKLDNYSEGAYPIMFNSDWAKVKFILYARYRKLRKKCHL